MIAIAPPEQRSAVVAAARGAGGQVLETVSDAVGLRQEPA